MRNWSRVTCKINNVQLLVLLTVLFLCSFVSGVEATVRQQRVVVVNVEGVTFNQAMENPQLKKAIEAWTLGFLIKNDQAFAANKLFLDIGSNGNTAVGQEPVEIVESRQIINDRMGREIIYSRTGILLKDSQAGVVDWPKLKQSSANAKLGTLAGRIAEAGGQTAYAGGLTRDQLTWRPGALMLADVNGIIPWVYNNSGFSYHDVAPLVKTLGAELTVIDLSLKHELELSELLQQLSSMTDAKTTVILSFLSEEETEGYLFYPVLLKEGGSKANLVKSDSTRRLGLINTADLHNYILSKITGSSTTLSKAEYKLAPNWQVFTELKQKMIWINTHRTQLCVMMGFVWLLHISLMFWTPMYKFGLAGAVASPLLGIIWSTSWLAGMTTVWLSLIVFELVILLISYLLGAKDHIITFLMVMFLLVLSIDQIGEGSLSTLSVWGPDAIIGVRYYGLGNELLALALVAAVWLLSRAGNSIRWPSVLLALWVIIMVFSPRFGANFGAGLVLVTTTFYWLLVQTKIQVKLPGLALLIVATGVLLAVWSVAESVYFHNSNHISNAVMNIFNNHYGAVFTILLNKLAIYQRVLGVSRGIEFFFHMFLAGVFLFWATADRIERLVGQQQFVFYKTLLFGSVLALLVNDTGIVTLILVLLQVISIGLSYCCQRETKTPATYVKQMHTSV